MADEFTALAESIRFVFPKSRIEPLPESELAALRQQYRDAPEHYFEFLRRIGWGSLGDSNFMIYREPVKPNEIFDERSAAELSGVLLLGDDWAGWMLGCDTRQGWQLVGVDSSSPEPWPLEERSLSEFIARRAAGYNEG